MTQSFNVLDSNLVLPKRLILEASAGTGKTFAIEHIVKKALLDGFKIDQMILITFTKASANDLFARIQKNLQAHPEQPVLQEALSILPLAKITTIHGFCQNLLSKFGYLADLPWSISLQEEKLDELIVDLLSKNPLMPTQMGIVWGNARNEKELAFEKIKASPPLPLNDFFSLPEPYEFEKLGDLFCGVPKNWMEGRPFWNSQIDDAFLRHNLELFKKLRERKIKKKKTVSDDVLDFWLDFLDKIEPFIDSKRLYSHLSFLLEEKKEKLVQEGVFVQQDQILLETKKAIKKKPFLDAIRKEFNLLIVDEFQDTDPVQWEIIQALCENFGFVCVVGDPKQSIYGFRKADPTLFKKAVELFGKENHFILNRNYRSSASLVHVFNNLFSKTESYYPVLHAKEDSPLPDDLGPLILFSAKLEERGRFPSLKEEKELIFPFIAKRLQQYIPNYSVALIVQDRYSAACAHEVLQKEGIACCVAQPVSFSESRFLTSFILFTRALLDSSFSLWKKVGYPDFTKEAEVFFGSLSESFTSKGVLGFLQAMEITPFAENKTLSVFFEEQEIAEMIWLEIAPAYPGSLFDLLFLLERLCKKTFKKMPSKNEVTIITTHSSKGLEFDVVFLTGLCCRSSQESSLEEMEEKIRLFYVAMTRAAKRCYLFVPSNSSKKNSPLEIWLEGLQKSPNDLLQEFPSLLLEDKKQSAFTEEKKEIKPYKKVLFLTPKQSSFFSYSKLKQKESFSCSSISSDFSGTLSGTIIHSVLERIFCGDKLEQALERALWATPLEPHKKSIEQICKKLLSWSFPGKKDSFCLADAERFSLYPELAFRSGNYKGAIDLVYRREGEIHLFDWKSNFLGATAEDYERENLEKTMVDFDYNLQYSIYLSAIETAKLSMKEPVIVHYVFLRGLIFNRGVLSYGL